MKTLELNQMEQINGGLSKCEVGMTIAWGFVVGAFSLATAGVGALVVGVVGNVAGSYATEAICEGKE